MAFDTFLVLKPKSSLPNFTANTTDPTFSKYIAWEVSSFALGYNESGSKLTLQTLHLTMPLDGNTSGFLTMAGQNLSFDSITLYIRKSGGVPSKTNPPYAIFHFGSVYVTTVTIDGNSGDDVPTVNVSLSFGQFAHHSATTDANGKLITQLKGTWDVVHNTAWMTEPTVDGPGWPFG